MDNLMWRTINLLAAKTFFEDAIEYCTKHKGLRAADNQLPYLRIALALIENAIAEDGDI